MESRRHFLGRARTGALTLAATLGYITILDNLPDTNLKIEENVRDELKSGDSAQTAISSFGLHIANRLAFSYLNRKFNPKLYFGNAQAFTTPDSPTFSSYGRRDIVSLVEALITAPISEEYLYRHVPSRLLAGNSGMRWDIGLPSAIVFGYIHNLTPWIFTNFGKTSRIIPGPQIVGGLYLWERYRHHGFWQAVIGHSINNAIPHLIHSVKQAVNNDVPKDLSI